MEHYYEVENKRAPQDGLPAGVIAFEDFESAIEYAEQHGCEIISEIGGSWTDFAKCAICGEWVDICELNKNNLCTKCES